jgi:hypothetical protein
MSQINALAQVKARKFIIGTIDYNGYFSLSSRPFYHGTDLEAKRECTRLATLNPGKAFIYMQLAGGAMLPAVTEIQSL